MSNNERHRWVTHLLRRLLAISNDLKRLPTLALRINKKLAGDNGGAHYVHDIVKQRFQTQGASSGTPWMSLAKSTVMQRERLGFGGSYPILWRSGTLARAAADITQAKTRCTPTTIFLTMKDAPSPRYTGKGRSRAKRPLGTAETRVFHLGGKINRLSDYADKLNEKRPFYGSPTSQELVPILTARNEIIELICKRILNGQPYGDVI